ncbi:zf-MYND-domain-containing protein [Panus rudis PR-1116 ss-1]|nr:zf-MYND-domain-containing protein [Panus rudis PR-1116 ss-1]
MSSLKTQMRRCTTCYTAAADKPLKACSRCKSAAYCSRECQKKDWPRHKPACNHNADLAEALKGHAETLEGQLQRFTLPDGITLYELDQRLEKWVRFHNTTLMVVTMHAIRVTEDLMRARTHVLYITLRARPRKEHGDSAGKFFAIKDAQVLSIAEARKKEAPWPESLDQLNSLQEDSEANGRGQVAAAMVQCEPLAVQTVPFGSLRDIPGSVYNNWKARLMEDIEKGKKFDMRYGWTR